MNQVGKSLLRYKIKYQLSFYSKMRTSIESNKNKNEKNYGIIPCCMTQINLERMGGNVLIDIKMRQSYVDNI